MHALEALGKGVELTFCFFLCLSCLSFFQRTLTHFLTTPTKVNSFATVSVLCIFTGLHVQVSTFEALGVFSFPFQFCVYLLAFKSTDLHVSTTRTLRGKREGERERQTQTQKHTHTFFSRKSFFSIWFFSERFFREKNLTTPAGPRARQPGESTRQERCLCP